MQVFWPLKRGLCEFDCRPIALCARQVNEGAPSQASLFLSLTWPTLTTALLKSSLLPKSFVVFEPVRIAQISQGQLIAELVNNAASRLL